MIVLREYQQRAAESIRHAFRRGLRRPLYVAPCGSGKTILFGYIAAETRRRGNSVVIVTHRGELLRQTVKELARFGIRAGVIAAGYEQTRGEPVQVASIQTLTRRVGQIPAPSLIIVDEAHHSLASTYRAVLGGWSSAQALGVTATPWRMNGQGLGEIYDTLIPGPAPRELIEAGFLAQPRYLVPPVVADLSGLSIRAGDYAKDEITARMDKPVVTGDAVQHYARLCPNARAVAFCTSIAHGDHVAADFRKAGIPAAQIDGRMSEAERIGMVKALEAGTIRVLTSCELIQEGFDLPALDAVIVLRPTTSLAFHIQCIGRAMRPAPGKTEALVLDHVGNCLNPKLGKVEDDREWTLEGRTVKKRVTVESVRYRRCPECFAVFTIWSRHCPECGCIVVVTAPSMPEQVAGELTDLEQLRQKERERRDISNAWSLESLLALAKRRGYKPGWAYHIQRVRDERGKRYGRR